MLSAASRPHGTSGDRVQKKIFHYLGYELECSAHLRVTHYEASLVIRRYTAANTWERVQTLRCGIEPDAEAAILCAKEHGERWIAKNG